MAHAYDALTTRPSPDDTRLPYWRSLDGLRGIAVLWVMGFHAGLDHFRGGYLGVSAFFTLSGFLLTSLALAEHRATGGFSFRSFWARRFRRLMPAAFLTLTAVVVMGLWVWSADQLANLRAEVLGALAYVANWQLIVSGHGYAQAFQASPVQHFWSLAIEEQFYLLFPLALGVAFLTGRHARRTLVGLFLVATVASIVLMAVLYDATSTARAYLGTGSRIGEITIGCLLALALHGRGEIRDPRLRRGVGIGGLAALAGCVALWTSVDITSAWLYHGGFALHATAVAFVLVAAVQPSGPVPAVLGFRPIVWLGTVSYGVYLFHWPLFLWIDHARTGLAPIPLFALRVAIVLVLAALSFRFVEVPARRGRLLSGWRGALAVPAAVVVVLGGVTMVSTPERLTGVTALHEEVADEPPDPGQVPGAPDDPEIPRILLLGDSIAFTMGVGIDNKEGELGLSVWNRAELGCGVVRGVDVELEHLATPRSEECDSWPVTWRADLDEWDPDAVVFLGGIWDVLDRTVEGRYLELGTPESDEHVLTDLHLMVDVLGADGALVVLLTMPYLSEHLENDPQATRLDERAPWRTDHWNGLLRRLAMERPDEVVLFDITSRLAPDGVFTATVEGVDVFGDGVHFTVEGSEWFGRWLGPRLRFVAAMHALGQEASRR